MHRAVSVCVSKEKRAILYGFGLRVKEHGAGRMEFGDVGIHLVHVGLLNIKSGIIMIEHLVLCIDDGRCSTIPYGDVRYEPERLFSGGSVLCQMPYRLLGLDLHLLPEIVDRVVQQHPGDELLKEHFHREEEGKCFDMGCPEREGRVSKKYPADPDERLEPLVQPAEPDPVDLGQSHRREADGLKHVTDKPEESEVLGTSYHPGHEVTGIFERPVQGVVFRKLMKDTGDDVEPGRICGAPRIDSPPDEMEVFASFNILPDLV